MKQLAELSRTIELIRNDVPPVETVPSITLSDEANKTLSDFNKTRVTENLQKSLATHHSSVTIVEVSEEKVKDARKKVPLPLQVEGVKRASWTDVEATPKERENYLTKLQNPKSDIYKCGEFRGLSERTRTCKGMEAKDLSNGKRIEVEELQAIQIFSSTFYKIINQGLRNDPGDFPIALKETNTP